jgi:hypothetical protein
MTYDPKAESRSLMMKQKVLCNGQATGTPCKHYWTMIRIVPSHNPDFLKQGEKLRFCRAWGAEPLEFGEGTTELAVHCSMYEPDASRKFDPHFEDYKPMTEDEAQQAGLHLPAPPLAVPVSPLDFTSATTTSTAAPAAAVVTTTDPSVSATISAAEAAQESSDD